MKKPLSSDVLIYGLETPVDPQIAPDGSAIVYGLTTADRETKKDSSQLWLCDLDGGNRSQLTRDGDSNGGQRWSPDSRRIAFASNRDDEKRSGLFLLSLDGGDPRKLADHRKGISDIAWSPDGSRIAYTATFDPENPEDIEPDEADAPPVRVTRRIDYKQDGRGYLGDAREQIYLVDVKSGEEKRLTGRAVDYSELQWSPDGKTIAAIVPAKNGMNSQLALVDIAGGKEKLVGPVSGVVASYAWSPDGGTIAFTGDTWPSHADDFFLYDVSSEEITRLTDDFGGEPSGGHPVWLDDHRLFFNGEESAASGLYVLDTSSGSDELLLSEAAHRTGMSVDRDRNHLVQIRQQIDAPGEIWVYDLASNTGRTITNYGDGVLEEYEPGSWERFEIERTGEKIEAWLLKPPGFDQSKQYPVVLSVHGGPNWFFGYQFNPRLLALAAAGYLTVFANPRGSTTYGRDFTQAVSEDWGGEDFQDLMACVDKVLERPYADADRTGITGYSYGGYMTAWTIGQTSRFDAAVCGAPCFDLESMYGTSDISHEFGELQWGGQPHDSVEKYAAHSPSTFARRATTPTLIIHGEADERCPIGQAEQMFVALLKAGCDVELARYPGGSHGFVGSGPPEHREDFLRRTVAWFDEYLGGGEVGKSGTGNGGE